MSAIVGQFVGIVLSIGIGLVLLAAGRRYYPIFVGVGGLTLVLVIQDIATGGESVLWLWILALVVGGVSAYLAPRFEDLSLRIAGFVLGGYLTIFLLSDNGYGELAPSGELLLFLGGGILGLVAIHYKRNEWIITLSSLVGAALVTNVLVWAPALRAAAFSGLAATGMLFQAREWILPAIPDHSYGPTAPAAPVADSASGPGDAPTPPLPPA